MLRRTFRVLYERGGDRKSRGITKENYTIDLIDILSFNEVRAFFYFMDAIKKDRPISKHIPGSAVHMMAEGLSPTWESVNGHDLSISIKRSAPSADIHNFYENLAMAVISGIFDEELCGLTTSMRYDKIMFRVWMRKGTAIADIEQRLSSEFKIDLGSPIVNNYWFNSHCFQ